MTLSPRISGRLERALSALACVALVAGFTAPTWRVCHGEGAARVCEWTLTRHGGTDDWRYFAGVWEAARVALQDFHEFPSWNPFHCGGIVLFQDPQAPFPGPLFLLTYAWLPAAAAMKLWLYLHLLAGAFGARALVRDQGGNGAEQVLAAGVLTACGFCSEHFGGGHLSFTPFLLFPWLLWAHRRAMAGATRYAVLVAALLALCVYEGATYPLPLMFVGLAFDTVLRLGDPAARRALLAALPVTGLLFPLLASPRLLPVMLYLKEHPRLVPLDDSMTVAEVVQTWTVRVHDRGFPGHVFVWPEYGDYIGWVPVGLAVLGVFAGLAQRDARRSERLANLGVFAALVWCALGNIPGFSLFGLLHELPLYKSLRVPSRFLYPATVLLALVVATTLGDARRWLVDRGARRWIIAGFVAFEALLATAVCVDIAVNNSPRLQQGIDPEIPRGRASRDFFQQVGGDYWRWSTYAVRGVGTPTCYVPLEWGPSPGLWLGPGPQARLDPPTAGEVSGVEWTPNSVRARVRLTRPAKLVVNQNHETSWSSSAGAIDRAARTLTVTLPAGRHDVQLRHRAQGLGAGVALGALGLALSALALWALRRDREDAMRAWITARLAPPTSLAHQGHHHGAADEARDADGEGGEKDRPLE